MMMPWKALLLGACLAGLAAPALAQPDFSGAWERYPPQGEAADPRYAPPPMPDPQLKPQYRAAWEAGRKIAAARLKEGRPGDDNYLRCLPDGMPAMMVTMFPMEIFQRAEQVNITQEAFNQTRRVYMNEKLPNWDEVNPSFYGRSVGHWEGDTLVVETTGIKEDVRFRGTPHSEGMKITERFRLLAPDILQDQISIEDAYFEKPWAYSYAFRRMKAYKMQEYVCEDNREYIDKDGNVRLRIGK
jgi:hypothetical protein